MGSLGVHESRYLVAVGGDAREVLAHVGHGYLTLVMSLGGLLGALMLGRLLLRAAVGSGTRSASGVHVRRVWPAASGALLGIFIRQELFGVRAGTPSGRLDRSARRRLSGAPTGLGLRRAGRADPRAARPVPCRRPHALVPAGAVCARPADLAADRGRRSAPWCVGRAHGRSRAAPRPRLTHRATGAWPRRPCAVSPRRPPPARPADPIPGPRRAPTRPAGSRFKTTSAHVFGCAPQRPSSRTLAERSLNKRGVVTRADRRTVRSAARTA